MGHSNKSRRRDTTDIANQGLPVSSYRPTLSPSPTRLGFSPLRVFEDRRTWHPEGSIRPAGAFSTPRHRLTVVDRVPSPRRAYDVARSRSFPTLWSGTKATVAFANPSRILICVRRSQRREVLHALNRTGRGGYNYKPRWSEYSSVRCK